MVGHAAGLVTCLTLMKDFKDNPQLQGVGMFITLFGYGLILAVIAALLWVFGRADYVVLPRGKRFNIPSSQIFWTTAACALLSTVLMAVAILIAVFEYGTL
jgi:Zn-dependent protease